MEKSKQRRKRIYSRDIHPDLREDYFALRDTPDFQRTLDKNGLKVVKSGVRYGIAFEGCKFSYAVWLIEVLIRNEMKRGFSAPHG